jgi:hypothetical protein
MKFIRWVLATQKREDAKWMCIAQGNAYSFSLALDDEDKIIKYKAKLDKARHDYSQLTWANI